MISENRIYIVNEVANTINIELLRVSNGIDAPRKDMAEFMEQTHAGPIIIIDQGQVP